MMLCAQADMSFVIMFAVVLIVVFTGFVVVVVKMFAPWIQAFLAGVPLRATEILGMHLRRTNVKRVVQALIMAHHAGAPLTSGDVEKAHLQGVNLEKVILAYVRSKKENLDLSFQDLVDADMGNRLDELLER
jgi:uncharacterized protein YqfA (UPF0365 family)